LTTFGTSSGVINETKVDLQATFTEEPIPAQVEDSLLIVTSRIDEYDDNIVTMKPVKKDNPEQAPDVANERNPNNRFNDSEKYFGRSVPIPDSNDIMRQDKPQ
jgi:hypothetical protein